MCSLWVIYTCMLLTLTQAQGSTHCGTDIVLVMELNKESSYFRELSLVASIASLVRSPSRLALVACDHNGPTTFFNLDNNYNPTAISDIIKRVPFEQCDGQTLLDTASTVVLGPVGNNSMNPKVIIYVTDASRLNPNSAAVKTAEVLTSGAVQMIVLAVVSDSSDTTKLADMASDNCFVTASDFRQFEASYVISLIQCGLPSNDDSTGAVATTGATDDRTGASGATGATEQKGQTGVTDPRGNSGETRLTGPLGPPTTSTPQGTNSPQGPLGTISSHGPQVTVSPLVPPGTISPQGPQETNGPQGTSGPQGPHGNSDPLKEPQGTVTRAEFEQLQALLKSLTEKVNFLTSNCL